MMQKVTVEGLSSSNRRCLYQKLKVLTVKASEPLRISVEDRMFYKRQGSLWFGGEVACISYCGWRFQLCAQGDVYADLFDLKADRLLAHIKDKNNAGQLGEVLLPYLKSDKALYAAMKGVHTQYRLCVENNNWWEAFVTDPNGVFHDLMWCLNADNLLDGIVEIVESMDAVIEDIEKQKYPAKGQS